MRILVTGGAGYIGSHTSMELAHAGHEVIIFDNLSTGWRDFAQFGSFVHGDILDTQALRKTFRACRVDAVIHFAAKAYVGESVKEPGKYFANNVSGTLSLLEAMHAEGVNYIVVSGTCAVYGEPVKMPISEDCPTHPVNPYGDSKLFMERMLAAYATAHGIHWASLRYFNAAGADVTGQIGERHMPETHLIPLVLKAAAEKKQLSIFGNDYSTMDGTCVRDYIHVSDLAVAHLLALEYLMQGGCNQVVNLGTGSGFSVLEIMHSVQRITGRNVPHVFVPRRAGDPPCLVANVEKAASLLRWRPCNSTLDMIIETAWQWYQKDSLKSHA